MENKITTRFSRIVEKFEIYDIIDIKFKVKIIDIIYKIIKIIIKK